MNASGIINFYGLQPHPEGGYYKQTYRSEVLIDSGALPDSFSGQRPISTAIYFLLPAGNFAAFHRIKSDELWHFYSGVSLHIHVIHQDGFYELLKLGSDIENGQSHQHKVPAGVWFASEPSSTEGFSFVGCTVSPGFDFNDFELATSDQLIAEYPHLEEIVSRLCR
jgi:predicted cupin superfamily sugar epimerase